MFELADRFAAALEDEDLDRARRPGLPAPGKRTLTGSLKRLPTARPALPREVSQYEYDQIRRLHAVPGITGLQQVSGRSNIDFKRWIELDLQYISEQSIWKDIEILLKTIPAVLASRGAY